MLRIQAHRPWSSSDFRKAQTHCLAGRQHTWRDTRVLGRHSQDTVTRIIKKAQRLFCFVVFFSLVFDAGFMHRLFLDLYRGQRALPFGKRAPSKSDLEPGKWRGCCWTVKGGEGFGDHPRETGPWRPSGGGGECGESWPLLLAPF